jgi:hypothetical protein
MNELRNIVNLMALIGIPSLFAIAGWFVKACFAFSHKIDILMNAQQKQMRRELTQDYHKYIDAGYIDDDDLDLWVESYKAYHELGQNGVMDKRKDDLIELNSHPKVNV